MVRQTLMDIANKRMESAKRNLEDCERKDHNHIGTLLANLSFQIMSISTAKSQEEARGALDKVKAVSYTHLDVYKRQAVYNKEGVSAVEKGMAVYHPSINNYTPEHSLSVYTVSYTHLDVYKRQVIIPPEVINSPGMDELIDSPSGPVNRSCR